MRIVSLVLACAFVMGATQARELLVWTPFEGPEHEVLARDVADFGSLFDVPVALERHDLADIVQRLRSGPDAGPVPDVVVGMPHERAAELAEAGVLRDLSATATETFLNDLTAPARRAFTVAGVVTGLPLFVEGPALVYDRGRIAAPPDSYAALLDLADAHTNDEAFGLLFDVENLYFAYGWLATHGGYVFARDEGGRPRTSDVGLDSDGAVAGARALRALRFEHALIPRGTTYADATARFRAGRVAMTLDGPWAVRPARVEGIDVAVAPMPPLADGTPWTGFMSVGGVVVPRDGVGGTDVANLAKWLVRSEAQRAYADAAGRVPASLRAGTSDAVDPAIRGFAEALRHAEPIPAVPEMGRVWGPVERALARILNDPDADPRTELEAAARAVRGE